MPDAFWTEDEWDEADALPLFIPCDCEGTFSCPTTTGHWWPRLGAEAEEFIAGVGSWAGCMRGLFVFGGQPYRLYAHACRRYHVSYCDERNLVHLLEDVLFPDARSDWGNSITGRCFVQREEIFDQWRRGQDVFDAIEALTPVVAYQHDRRRWYFMRDVARALHHRGYKRDTRDDHHFTRPSGSRPFSLVRRDEQLHEIQIELNRKRRQERCDYVEDLKRARRSRKAPTVRWQPAAGTCQEFSAEQIRALHALTCLRFRAVEPGKLPGAIKSGSPDWTSRAIATLFSGEYSHQTHFAVEEYPTIEFSDRSRPYQATGRVDLGIFERETGRLTAVVEVGDLSRDSKLEMIEQSLPGVRVIWIPKHDLARDDGNRFRLPQFLPVRKPMRDSSSNEADFDATR